MSDDDDERGSRLEQEWRRWIPDANDLSAADPIIFLSTNSKNQKFKWPEEVYGMGPKKMLETARRASDHTYVALSRLDDGKILQAYNEIRRARARTLIIEAVLIRLLEESEEE